MEQARAGQHDGYAQLARYYAPRLYGYIRQRAQSHEDAEDLVQDTLVKAYRNLDKYDSQYRFSTWLFVMATRLTHSWYRKGRRTGGSEIVENLADADNVGAYIERESQETIWEYARELGGVAYEVLWLKYHEGLSVDEISAVCEKSKANVKVILHRARKALAERLPDEFQPSGPGREAGN